MKKGILLLLSFVTLSASAKLRPWNQKMQQIGKTFSELLPEVVGTDPLSAEAKKKLAKGTKELTELAHTIRPGKDAVLPPESDPTLRFVSGLFEREAKAAYRATRDGEYGYARQVVQRMAGYCLACHTRHDRGPDFPTFDVSPRTEKLTALERGELFAALRQFDSALDELEKAAGDAKLAETRPFDWARAVRHGFSIAVRVKDDPEKAEAIIDRALTLPDAPRYFREDAAGWKQNIAQWKADRGKVPQTEEGLFLEAVRLMEKARAKQEFLMDHTQDIYYLRATALVHQLLAKYPSGERTSEALLLAGNAYNVLDSAILFPLPELYYEACIRRSPGTPVAKTCYRRYEEAVYFGYTGSGGTFIPEELRGLMGELRKLSEPPVKK